MKRELHMRRTSLAAGAFAAALVAGVSAASAADLDYGRAPTDRYSSAYEDPRYRDLYAPEPPPQRYGYAPSHPVPPAYVYRDSPYRYGEADRRGCLPREAIRERLLSEGWRDFRDLDLRGGVARVHARRPNGELYALKVDRCSGEIINTQFIGRGGIGPYAYDDVPPRRPYY